jgi:hypothetical protein
MKLAINALAFLFLLSSPAVADPQPPTLGGSFTTATGRGIVSPALQLPLQKVPPVQCSEETAGTIALNSRADLCLCDGKNWRASTSDTACVWDRAPQ